VVVPSVAKEIIDESFFSLKKGQALGEGVDLIADANPENPPGTLRVAGPLGILNRPDERPNA
jgi:hypothetical protein